MIDRTLGLRRELLRELDAGDLARVRGAGTGSGLECLTDTLYDCMTVETGLECIS